MKGNIQVRARTVYQQFVDDTIDSLYHLHGMTDPTKYKHTLSQIVSALPTVYVRPKLTLTHGAFEITLDTKHTTSVSDDDLIGLLNSTEWIDLLESQYNYLYLSDPVEVDKQYLLSLIQKM